MNAVDAGNELYRELVLEHKRAPRNFGALDVATHRAQGHNPQCGDDVRVELRVDGERLADIRFAGQGCAICIASASMMTEAVKGRAIAEAEQLQQRFRAVLTGQLDPESAALGKLESLAGVRHYPARIKCALLGWHALMHALADVEAPADAPERPQGRASPARPSARVGQEWQSHPRVGEFTR